MSPSFQAAKDFVETKPACNQALQKLKKGAEIRVLIDSDSEAALFHNGDRAQLELRPAKKPDVEFDLSTPAIEKLSHHPGENVGQLGIEVVKEIAQGRIKVKVCGKIMGVLTNGYLNIIKEAGPDFMSYLAQHGLSSITKIISVIKSMKKG